MELFGDTPEQTRTEQTRDTQTRDTQKCRDMVVNRNPMPYFLIGLQMKFLEICFMKHLEGEDTSYDFEPKIILKMFFFKHKTCI